MKFFESHLMSGVFFFFCNKVDQWKVPSFACRTLLNGFVCDQRHMGKQSVLSEGRCTADFEGFYVPAQMEVDRLTFLVATTKTSK